MNFQERYSDYLEHYGTRGMRWGIRKAKNAGKGLGKTVATVAKPGVKFIGRNVRDIAKFIGRTAKSGAKTVAAATRGEDPKKAVKMNAKDVKKAFKEVKNQPVSNFKSLKKDYKNLFN